MKIETTERVYLDGQEYIRVTFAETHVFEDVISEDYDEWRQALGHEGDLDTVQAVEEGGEMNSMTEQDKAEFISGFLDCIAWVDDYTEYDYDEDTRQGLEQVAGKFYDDNLTLLSRTPKSYDMHQAGIDLWLTAVGYGAGYWEDEAGDVGDELTEKAHATQLEHAHAYLNDDSLICVEGLQ